MTASAEHLPGINQPLTTRNVPKIYSEQLKLYHYDNLHIRKSEEGFRPATVEEILWLNSGQQVLGLCIDTEQIVAIPFHVQNGKLLADQDRITRVSSEESGKHYVPFLDAVALTTRNQRIPIGIATIGGIQRTQLVTCPELPGFMQELKRSCDGDFSYLFPTLAAVNNTTQSSLKTAAVHAERTLGETRGVLFVSNDYTSFRGGVIKDGMVFPMEPGHVPSLYTTGQTIPCGVNGSSDICMEQVVTGRGIDEALQQRKSTSTPHDEPAHLLQRESGLAEYLYDNSALMTATAIFGMARSVWLMQEQNDTAVALDGSTFTIPSYGPRVMQILSHHLGFEPPFFFTAPYSLDVAAEGAAISALVSQTMQRRKSSRSIRF